MMSKEAHSLRVTIVCGSLDPGRDGVGDYSRVLACALAERGHHIELLSLADRNIKASTASVDASGIRMLRTNAAERPADWTAIRDHIVGARPDFLSFQFVPWSYGHRGVSLNLGSHLRGLTNTTRWQVMCHELWLTDGPLRHRLLGRVQRASIQRVLRQLDPAVIHASTLSNVSLLGGIGFAATKLPLYGNLPAPKHPRTTGSPVPEVLFFGELPPAREWPAYIGALNHATRYQGPLRITVAGGREDPRTRFVRTLNAAGLPAENAGFLDELQLSELFNRVTVGVSRNDGRTVGKSGSLHAMLEYGLPVWAPQLGQSPDLDFRPDRVFVDLDVALATPHVGYKSALPTSADAFIDSLRRHV
jgi:hypothetical protein